MPTRLESEIREQARVLERRAQPGLVAARKAADLIAHDQPAYLLLAARGSSDNVARYAQYAFGSEARIATGLAAPSLFRDPETAPTLAGAAAIGISQSGQSPDVVSVLTAARMQRRPTLAITNDPSSPLADAADVVVPLGAGPESSVAATKTYLASLHAIQQIIQALRPSAERLTWLERLPSFVDEAVESALASRSAFEPLVEATYLTVLGRGMDLGTACETALKLRELSGTPAEAFSPPDLLHGPIASLPRSSHLWLVSTTERPDPLAVLALERAAASSLRTIVASSSRELRAKGDVGVAIAPAPPTWARSILAVIPAQVAALHVAVHRGIDVDSPHGLTKITITT